MEKKQLLLITKNSKLTSGIDNEACHFYDITTVKSIHAGYPLALSYLPDVVVIDYSSQKTDSLRNLANFKSTHFLNKSFLFLLVNPEDKEFLNKRHKDYIDGILPGEASCKDLVEQIEETIKMKRCLTNYWKDAFMGLFNLLDNPVILLQDEKIVAMNDSFRNDFFVTKPHQVKLSNLINEKNQFKIKETLRKFDKSKHMKSSTTTTLQMNGKLREAKLTFAKLDKMLRGQLVMMINFTGRELPINKDIGSSSPEIEKHFSGSKEHGEKEFTKREKEVISLLCKGYKTKEISEALCISAKTIEKHRSNIIKRTHSGTIVESIVFALNNNMIDI